MPKTDAHKALSLFALLFLLLIALLCLARWVSPALCAAYLAASGASFVLYWVDKSAAAGNRRRIRERNLLLLGLIGGWPGAVLAQRVLRHKSHKPSFQTTFRLTVLLNCAGFLIAAGRF